MGADSSRSFHVRLRCRYTHRGRLAPRWSDIYPPFPPNRADRPAAHTIVADRTRTRVKRRQTRGRASIECAWLASKTTLKCLPGHSLRTQRAAAASLSKSRPTFTLMNLYPTASCASISRRSVDIRPIPRDGRADRKSRIRNGHGPRNCGHIAARPSLQTRRRDARGEIATPLHDCGHGSHHQRLHKLRRGGPDGLIGLPVVTGQCDRFADADPTLIVLRQHPDHVESGDIWRKIIRRALSSGRHECPTAADADVGLRSPC